MNTKSSAQSKIVFITKYFCKAFIVINLLKKMTLGTAATYSFVAYKGFLKELEFVACFLNEYKPRSDNIRVYCKKISYYNNGWLGSYCTSGSYEYHGIITNIVSPKKNLKSELKTMKKANVKKHIKINDITALWESML